MHHVRSSITDLGLSRLDEDDEPRSPSDSTSDANSGRPSVDEHRPLQHASTWNPQNPPRSPQPASTAAKGSTHAILGSPTNGSALAAHTSTSHALRQVSRVAFKTVLAELNRRHYEIDELRNLVSGPFHPNKACAQDELGQTAMMRAVV
jgi:hypothetical protein